MAESCQIKKVSHMHVAILDYMLANPMVSKGQIAKQFNVTPTWLSIVINSHAFQDMLKARQEEFFGAVVVPLREKMIGVVDQCMDRIAEKIEVMDSAQALETADTLLHRLGYAPNTKVNGQQPPGGGMVQQNNYYVGSDVLNNARARFGQGIEKEITNVEISTLIESSEGDRITTSE